MLWVQYLMAAMLLTAPPNTGTDADPAKLCAILAPALRHTALEWELLDPREVNYVFKNGKGFRADLNMLRRRYQKLADAPPMRDSLRFPSQEQIVAMLAFNRSYRQGIALRKPFEMANSRLFQSLLEETDQLYRIWDKVRVARSEANYVTYRRQSLKDLRQLLGEEVYYSGQMPPHVPVVSGE